MYTNKGLILILLLLVLSVFLRAEATEWQWAVGAGGASADGDNGVPDNTAIVTDNDGNVYVTGRFQGTASFGQYTRTSAGGYDIFVAKIDSVGNWLWVITAGGGGNIEYGRDIILSNEYLYVTGCFSSYSILMGSTTLYNSETSGYEGAMDIFVAKVDKDGNWVWAIKAGGRMADSSASIASDYNGNIYVTGWFNSNTITFGDYSLTIPIARGQMFVAKISSSGEWMWAKKGGSNNQDGGLGIAVDSNQHVFVTGIFNSTSVYGETTLEHDSDIFPDIFVAKLDINGNWLWAKKAGGSSYDYSYGIKLDSNDNIYICGTTLSGTAIFGQISINPGSETYGKAYVAKLDNGGNWLWVSYSRAVTEYGMDIDIDNLNNVYFVGSFYYTAWFGPFSLHGNLEEVFVSKLDSDGNWLWATSCGGNGYDYADGIAFRNGDVFISGCFSNNFSCGNTTFLSNGGLDIFVAKLIQLPGMNIPANILTNIGDVALTSSIDLVTIPTIDSNTPVVVALPNILDLSNPQVIGLSGSGIGNLTIAVGPGLWLGLIYYNNQWHQSSPVLLHGPGNLTFLYVDFNAKGEVIIVLSHESDTTLPVELSSFTGFVTDTGLVTLSWISQSETNLLGYYVYRSETSDFSSSTLVSNLISATNTSTQSAYSYNDNEIPVEGSYYYWLESRDYNGASQLFGPVSITYNAGDNQNDNPVPGLITELRSVFPNPFNPLLNIPYYLSEPSGVSIRIYNNKGQLVHKYTSTDESEGNHKIVWDGRDLKGKECSTGIYYINFQAGSVIQTRKAALLK